MPCNDVTETIRLRLDAGERFQSYSLKKKTCGGGVGAADLIQDLFQGRTPEDILAMAPETLSARLPSADEVEEFLAFKHFFAVQIALEVLTGREPGGARDRCVVAGVSFDEEGLTFEADIPVELPTERIRACGRCKRCPTAQIPR